MRLYLPAILVLLLSTPSLWADNPLDVMFFYSPSCSTCDKDLEKVAQSTKRWGSHVRMHKLSISKMENLRDMLRFEDHYKSNEQAPPKVFAGSQYLAGSKALNSKLDKLIEQELKSGSVTWKPAAEKAADAADKKMPPKEIMDKFKTFGVSAIAIAGLIDGINPCAFTTIIFLLSMLAYLGKSRRQLLVVGLGFTTAVFVTYFLLGIGIFGTIKAFSVSHGIAAGISYTVAGLTFCLAIWSFVDCFRYARTGDVKKATLGLPKSIKAKIHKVIRVGLSTRGLLIGSLTVGFAVALLESLCTGQVYLPTIVFVSRSPDFRTAAMGYLLLYNVLFILPLVAVLVMAYFGVGSESLGRFLKRRLAIFKFAMGFVFAGLGVLVIMTA